MDAGEVPPSIPWEKVQLILALNPTSVSILFEGCEAPQHFQFSSAEEKERVLQRWFEQASKELNRPGAPPWSAKCPDTLI